jgi:hypothetical protein
VTPAPASAADKGAQAAAEASAARAQADAETQKMRADAEAMKRQAEVELARARSDAESSRAARAKADAEAAATKTRAQAEADAARIRAEAQAAAARTRSDAEAAARPTESQADKAAAAVVASGAAPALASSGTVAAAPDKSARPGAGNVARFDGTWSTSVDCPKHEDGAFGYVIDLVVQVKDGVLRGERGAPGAPNWLRLQGNIQPDGSATIEAKGTTGDPKFLLKGGKQGVPYEYTVLAKFDESRGTGRRIQLRACRLTFAKQQ